MLAGLRGGHTPYNSQLEYQVKLCDGKDHMLQHGPHSQQQEPKQIINKYFITNSASSLRLFHLSDRYTTMQNPSANF